MILPLIAFNATTNRIVWRTGLIGKYKFKIIKFILTNTVNVAHTLHRIGSSDLFNNVDGQFIYFASAGANRQRMDNMPEFTAEVDDIIDLNFTTIYANGNRNLLTTTPTGVLLLMKVEKIN